MGSSQDERRACGRRVQCAKPISQRRAPVGSTPQRTAIAIGIAMIAAGAAFADEPYVARHDVGRFRHIRNGGKRQLGS